jgi:hypothetical protein
MMIQHTQPDVAKYSAIGGGSLVAGATPSLIETVNALLQTASLVVGLTIGIISLWKIIKSRKP